MKIIVSVDINAPKAIVFDYLTDSDKLPRWQKFLKEAHNLSGDLDIGSRFRNLIEYPDIPLIGALKLELDGEVIGLKPPTLLEITANSAIGRLKITYELDEPGGVTTITQQSDFEFSASVMRLLADSISPFLQARFEEDFGQLKELVENTGIENSQ